MGAAAGRIVILNGAPRSGKSSIAAAMQASLAGNWINLGVDAQNNALPAKLRPGIGLRPGGERPELEAVLPALFAALYDSIAAYAREGFDVVADLGHHDDYSRPLGLLAASARRLAGMDVLFVGVHCPIDIIMARRGLVQEGREGLYLQAGADGAIPAPILRWQQGVHVPGIYDLELDTGRMTPEACVAAIAEKLADPPMPSAFSRLAQM